MSFRLLALGLGIAVGYVLGTRDGRERYNAMKSKVTDFWEDPRVAKARVDVENFAKAQAPVIMERAEAAAKAAPGVVADGAKMTADAAREAADRTAEVAKDVAGRVSATAKDVAEKISDTAKEVVDKVTGAPKTGAPKTGAPKTGAAKTGAAKDDSGSKAS